MQNRLMKISDIKANPNNPRIIKDDKFKKLVESVKNFPEMLELRPIVVNKDMIILGGNMRFKACKEAWIKEIPVIIADNLTEEQEREFLIKDNVSGGEWDWDILANEWDKEELEEWGLDVQFETVEPEAEEDDFEVDEGIKTDIVLWDLFEIWPHRLLCWDSTNIDDVNKLMNGEKADMVHTDPPYNVNAESRSKKWIDKILNDNMSDDNFIDFIRQVFSNLKLYTKENWVFYIWHNHKCQNIFENELLNLNLNITSQIIWVKDIPSYSDNLYRQQHEICFYCRWKDFIDYWYKSETIWQIPSIQSANSVWDDWNKWFSWWSKSLNLHVTQKPIKIPEKAITHSSKKDDIVLDLFWWSGSTMVACHQLNRKCYMSELDPKYVQTIINRMIKIDSTLEIKRNWVQYSNSDVTVK